MSICTAYSVISSLNLEDLKKYKLQFYQSAVDYMKSELKNDKQILLNKKLEKEKKIEIAGSDKSEWTPVQDYI